MNVLGCDWEQWPIGDLDPDWFEVRNRMEALRDENDITEVYAPVFESLGHVQHNVIANLAADCFGSHVTYYLTYTSQGKSKWGTPVPYETEWVRMKLEALACYQSQITHPLQAEHFLRSWREYYAK